MCCIDPHEFSQWEKILRLRNRSRTVLKTLDTLQRHLQEHRILLTAPDVPAGPGFGGRRPGRTACTSRDSSATELKHVAQGATADAIEPRTIPAALERVQER